MSTSPIQARSVSPSGAHWPVAAHQSLRSASIATSIGRVPTRPAGGTCRSPRLIPKAAPNSSRVERRSSSYDCLPGAPGGPAPPNAAAAGHTLTLSCAGLPAGLACSFNPPTITLGAVGTTTTSTLTITRTTTAALLHPSSPWMLATWMGMVPAIVLVGLRSPRRRRGSMMWLGMIVACTGIWVSCGGGGMSRSTTPTATPQGTYTVIVVGNSGGMQASTTVNLTVQ